MEFEPTASQPALSRPLPPPDPNGLGSSATEIDRLLNDNGFAGREQEEDPGITADVSAVTNKVSPLLYLLHLLVAAVVAVLFLSRRFRFGNRVPALLRVGLERTGLEVPRWVYHWEYWVGLSQIEKAFERINFGLRTLDRQAIPVHNSPVERARKLTSLLPQMSGQIKLLLDEHQTYLYTSRIANVVQARSAAFDIRKEVIVERFRYLLFGKPMRD